MRVFYIESPRSAVYKDLPVRSLEPDEVLCRVGYTGICGADLAIYSGETGFVRDGAL